MSAKRSEFGFSLIEVVVAFVIAALVLVAAMRLFGGAFEGSARAERMTLALVAAESTLGTFGASLPLRPGMQSGDLGEGMSWIAKVQPYTGLPDESLERLPVQAYDVSVTVRWDRHQRDSVTLRTLKLIKRADNE
ncbi:MAG: prepilin-type N-terminal cleavage/methylation domain-containing protein [Alphaproteobacteria bacterium]|nr:prepilin-type N-terminal cleavage/methylation domain-containing protein [Alphaproteobacteria bacterium]